METVYIGEVNGNRYWWSASTSHTGAVMALEQLVASLGYRIPYQIVQVSETEANREMPQWREIEALRERRISEERDEWR